MATKFFMHVTDIHIHLDEFAWRGRKRSEKGRHYGMTKGGNDGNGDAIGSRGVGRGKMREKKRIKRGKTCTITNQLYGNARWTVTEAQLEAMGKG